MKNKLFAVISFFLLFFVFNLQVLADDLDDDSAQDEVEEVENDSSDDSSDDEDEDADESEDDETDDEDSDSQDALDEIEDATEEIEEAEDKINEKEAEGSDVIKAEERLENANLLLVEAQAAYDIGDFENAENLAEEAKHEAMYARGKDIESDSEESQIGEEFGECISTKVDDEEDDFEDCFEDFFDSVADRIFELLPQADQDANSEIQAAIQELLSTVEGDLKDLLLEFASYNFSGVDSDEAIEEMEDVLDDDDSDHDKIEELEDLFDDLKEESLESKFEHEVIPFKDTDDKEWFFNFVDQLEAEQCVEGFKDVNGNLLGEFRPGNQVLLGESLKFVLKCVLVIDPIATTQGDFWALGYAVKIKLEFEDLLDDDLLIKIEDSIEDEDKFNEAMTRAELVALIIDVLDIDIPQAAEAPFADVSLSHDYVDEIAYALSMGIISGDQETGMFRPDDVPNRAEVAKIIVLAKQLL